tara:strand:+ start:52 stop:1227 length:1176 start_codon:yes stop_codon:yes gene_type:complete
MKIFKTYFVISLLSIVSALYLSEGYLTYISDLRQINVSKINKILQKEKNLKYDNRTKFEIYKDLNLEDKNVTVTVSPSKFNDPAKKLHFFSGISNSKTIDCNENGYYSIHVSDRFGFNNPDNEWDEKEIEYLLVGDSFAHGACVNRPNDVSSVLRSLTNKSVLNLGYKANGPLSMYGILKEYAPEKFKHLLWLYFEGNDLTDLTGELNTDILKNYYFDKNFKQNLNLKQEYIDKQIKKIILNSTYLEDSIVSDAIKNSSMRYKILKFIRLNQTKEIIKSFFTKNKSKELPIDELRNILFFAKEFAKNNNSEFHFIYLPQYERYKRKINDNNYNMIKAIVNNLDINFIDLHQEVFVTEKDPLKLFPFRMWGHYNELGYKKIGEKILTLVNAY